MEGKDFVEYACNTLDPILDEPGAILYSSFETLKPGSLYFLGFNPGGSGGVLLRKNIQELMSRSENAFLDEDWSNGIGQWKEGMAPLQKRVQWVLQTLGLDVADVCASNLIFSQSKKATDIPWRYADICWPVHERILKVVKPKIIVTFGNSELSPFAYIYSKFSDSQQLSNIESGHGNWKIKQFSANINGCNVLVIGFPHLSDPVNNSV